MKFLLNHTGRTYRIAITRYVHFMVVPGANLFDDSTLELLKNSEYIKRLVANKRFEFSEPSVDLAPKPKRGRKKSK